MAVLVGKEAPDFKEKTVVNNQIVEDFTLSQFRGKKYVVLFFYPLDFTFVCPTELHAFDDKFKNFQDKNAELIAVSTDSWYSHLAWLNTSREEGGIKSVRYPIVSDFNKTISRDYDVLLEGGMALRGLFIIDREGIVKHQLVNDLPFGRNVDEALRMLDAIQFYEEHGEVCPANWQIGKKGMKTTNEGLKKFFNN